MTRKNNTLTFCLAAAICLSAAKAEGQVVNGSLPPGIGQDSAASSTPAIGQTSAVSTTQTNEGERALDLGEYARAETIFIDQLKNRDKNNPDRPYYQVGLAEALINQGRFPEATKEYKKAQSLVESLPKQTELTARLYDGLSWLAHAQGKIDEAISWAQKAVAVRKSLPTTSPISAVATLSHLGTLMDAKGQVGEATKYWTQALAIQDAQAGSGSLVAADLQEEIGSALRRQGEIEKSKQYFSAALQTKLAKQGPLSQYEPHAYWETITYPFVEGSPNCMRRFEDGSPQLLVTANGVTVAASLRPVEATKATQVNIIVHNDSKQDIQFLPIPPSLTMTQPKIAMAPQVDPTKLATTVEKKGDRKAAWIRFWGSQATQTMTSTCIGQPGFFGYPPVYGGGYGYSNFSGPMGNYSSWAQRSGDMTIMTTNVPDYAAQARAIARAADVSNQAHEKGSTIKASGLGPTTIPAGQTISGALYFDAPKMTESVVRVPIGNAVFEFVFPPK